MEPDVKIYVAMHKPDDHVLKIPYDYYVPIHCGKAIYEKRKDLHNIEFLPELGDDTGDNISKKNGDYCELTGLYWIWKNDKSNPDDIVGLNHYRRYFCKPCTESMQFMDIETMKDMLSQCDFIVNGDGTERDCIIDGGNDCNVYNGFKSCHVVETLDLALEGVSVLFPDLFESMEYQIKKNCQLDICNMFITRKKYLDEYCSFLFPVLKYVEDNMNWSKEYLQGRKGRWAGFLSERLERAWIRSSNHTAKQGPSLDWERYSGYVWA